MNILTAINEGILSESYIQLKSMLDYYSVNT